MKGQVVFIWVGKVEGPSRGRAGRWWTAEILGETQAQVRRHHVSIFSPST